MPRRGNLPRGQAADGLATKLDRAPEVSSSSHAGDQVEGGGLAGAVGADQADDLPGLDLKN
jgi:hypothetical protein